MNNLNNFTFFQGGSVKKRKSIEIPFGKHTNRSDKISFYNNKIIITNPGQPARIFKLEGGKWVEV